MKINHPAAHYYLFYSKDDDEVCHILYIKTHSIHVLDVSSVHCLNQPFGFDPKVEEKKFRLKTTMHEPKS